MASVRDMKRQGLQRERAARRATGLTPNDAREVERFRSFLADSTALPLPDLVEKHGADYLGLTDAEVAVIKKKAST